MHHEQLLHPGSPIQIHRSFGSHPLYCGASSNPLDSLRSGVFDRHHGRLVTPRIVAAQDVGSRGKQKSLVYFSLHSRVSGKSGPRHPDARNLANPTGLRALSVAWKVRERVEFHADRVSVDASEQAYNQHRPTLLP